MQATPVANNRARLSLIKAQNSTGHADRPHSPAPESFSQPRPRKDGECNVFGQPSYFADHGATASSVALYEPKRTPDIVHIRRSSTTRVAQINAKAAEPPTFGARRLDNPSDFAALIRESPTRKSSDLVYPNPTQTPYQDSTPSRSSVSADKSQSDVSPQLSESSNYASHDEAILGAQRHQVASEPAREPDVNKTNAHHRAAFDLLTASHIDQSNPHDILWPSNNPSAQPHPGSKVVIESSTTHQPSLRHIVYQQANRGPYDQAQQHLTDSYEVVVQDDIVSHQTRDNSTAPSMASPFTPSYAQATAASQRRRSDGPNSMWSASTAKSLPPTVEYPPRHSSKLAHGRAMVNRATASSRKAFSDEKLSDFRDDFAEDSLSRRYTPKFANSGLYNRYKTPVKTMSFESSEQVGSHGGVCSDLIASLRVSLIDEQKLVASNSKNRLLNNIIGLFSSKREANNAINNGNGVKPRRFKSPRKRKNGPSTDSLNGSGLRTKDDHFSVAGERDSSSLAVQKIAHFATQAWQQAGNTADDARKERMFAIASVLLDALTNSKEAEKAMLEAHKAAVAAQASYAMMQHGLVEIARLLDNHANAISTLDSTDMKGGQV